MFATCSFPPPNLLHHGTVAYVGSHYGYNVTTGVATSYYPAGAGSTRVAMRVEGDPDPAKNGVYYLHADHPSTSLRASLGSASLTTDASGNPTSQLRYLPYGAPCTGYPTGSVPTDYRFTGQRSEEATLGSPYDYGARFYSPYHSELQSGEGPQLCRVEMLCAPLALSGIKPPSQVGRAQSSWVERLGYP